MRSIDTYEGGDTHPIHALNNLICDTYPDFYGIQRLYALDLNSQNYRELISLPALYKYKGSQRVDLHPKASSDKKFISIDVGSFSSRKNLILKLHDA